MPCVPFHWTECDVATLLTEPSWGAIVSLSDGRPADLERGNAVVAAVKLGVDAVGLGIGVWTALDGDDDDDVPPPPPNNDCRDNVVCTGNTVCCDNSDCHDNMHCLGGNTSCEDGMSSAPQESDAGANTGDDAGASASQEAGWW